MKKSSKTANIPAPEHEYRAEVHTDWRYGKHAKFWEIQKFNQELSNRYGKVYYARVSHGLAYTQIGMWWAIHRKLKKMKVGYSTKYYSLDKRELA